MQSEPSIWITCQRNPITVKISDASVQIRFVVSVYCYIPWQDLVGLSFILQSLLCSTWQDTKWLAQEQPAGLFLVVNCARNLTKPYSKQDRGSHFGLTAREMAIHSAIFFISITNCNSFIGDLSRDGSCCVCIPFQFGIK